MPAGKTDDTQTANIREPMNPIRSTHSLLLPLAAAASLAGAGLDPALGALPGDGWQRIPYSETRNLFGVAHFGDRFLVTGSARILQVVDDAVADVLIAPGGYRGALHAVARDPEAGGRFVAVGEAGASAPRLLVSDDAVTWQDRTRADGNIFRDLQDVLWDGERFVVVGDKSVWTSADGLAWDRHTSISRRSLRAVALGAGRYVAVGDGGVVIHSNDGVNWREAQTPHGFDTPLKDVAWGGGKFVAVGRELRLSAGVLVSDDGVVWEDVWTGLPELRGIAHGAGWFVAVGVDGTIAVSRDALRWEREHSGVVGNLNGIAFAHGQFLAVGQDGALVTTRVAEPPMPAPVLRVVASNSVSRELELAFTASAGSWFRVESSRDLQRWEPLGDPIDGAGQRVRMPILAGREGRVYFRVRRQ